MHHFGAGTHIGKIRDNNEDSYVCDAEKELWIVADGMGGLGFGEVASAIATFTVTKMIRQGQGINQAIELAHAQIKTYAESEGMGTNMGTTIVLLLSQGSRYNIFWVGDSRAYLLDDQQFNQITVDHSLVQTLIQQGELTAEEARVDPRKNAVTRALGVQELETARADSISNKWLPNQKILLCSDGLTDCVGDAGIEAILRQEGTDQALSDRLIDAALAAGGKDNVTVIVISASKMTKQDESDTHVPPGVKDDDTDSPLLSSSPDSDNSHRPQGAGSAISESFPEGTQLELAIPDVRAGGQASTNPMSEQSLPATKFSGRLKIFAAIGALIALTSYIGLVATNPGERPLKPTQFSQQQVFSERSKRVFPPIDLPDKGATIQVGVFSVLGSAEDKQFVLVHLGLEPYIEKRPMEDGLFYAVLLGPLSSETHETAVVTLNANNLSYFQLPSQGP